ncbi:hypothetical protein ACFQ6B_37765 [Streptomyces wedmorensis]|uniref:NACHT domain-containing protein n=1 Tax=Streptomyces wedmorensis TaxID=43759 RepID=A0ABW6J131_STRWE
MCIHGGAGFGKTLAVNTCLRELEPGEDVRKITFRAPAHRPRGALRAVHRAGPGRRAAAPPQ